MKLPWISVEDRARLPWISVDEKLPNEGAEVIVSGLDMGEQWIWSHAFRGENDWCLPMRKRDDFYFAADEGITVTHWLEVVPPEEIPE